MTSEVISNKHTANIISIEQQSERAIPSNSCSKWQYQPTEKWSPSKIQQTIFSISTEISPRRRRLSDYFVKVFSFVVFGGVSPSTGGPCSTLNEECVSTKQSHCEFVAKGKEVVVGFRRVVSRASDARHFKLAHRK